MSTNITQKTLFATEWEICYFLVETNKWSSPYVVYRDKRDTKGWTFLGYCKHFESYLLRTKKWSTIIFDVLHNVIDENGNVVEGSGCTRKRSRCVRAVMITETLVTEVEVPA